MSLLTAAATIQTDATDSLYELDATGGAFTVTLPDAQQLKGKRFTFKHLAGTNAVTLQGASVPPTLPNVPNTTGAVVTGVTNAVPAVVANAYAAGAVKVGQTVTISGVLGALGANGTWVVSAVTDTVSFTINNTVVPGVFATSAASVVTLGQTIDGINMNTSLASANINLEIVSNGANWDIVT